MARVLRPCIASRQPLFWLLPYPNSDGADRSRIDFIGQHPVWDGGGGGSAGNGTVFALNTDGTGFTNLYSFTAILYSANSDGANPCRIDFIGQHPVWDGG